MSEYVSYFTTETGICAIYHNKIIIIPSENFATLITPTYMFELAKHTTFPQLLNKGESSLPKDIRYDVLIENHRRILAGCLVFIHTWIEENNKEYLLEENYSNSFSFIHTILSFIKDSEGDYKIISTCKTLLENVLSMEYLSGCYKGSLKENVHNITDMGTVLGLCFSNILISSV